MTLEVWYGNVEKQWQSQQSEIWSCTGPPIAAMCASVWLCVRATAWWVNVVDAGQDAGPTDGRGSYWRAGSIPGSRLVSGGVV